MASLKHYADQPPWNPGISAMKTFSRSLTFPCSPNAGTMLLSVICTRSSIIYPLLLTLTTLTPGLHSVTWMPVLLFLLSVVWPCVKNPFILMLQHSGITSLRTSSNAILCSPLSQPAVPILASQFHCLFWCLFFLCLSFIFLFIFAVLLFLASLQFIDFAILDCARP